MTAKDELKAFYIEEKDVDAYNTLFSRISDIDDLDKSPNIEPETFVAPVTVIVYVIGLHDVIVALNYGLYVNAAVYENLYKWVHVWG